MIAEANGSELIARHIAARVKEVGLDGKTRPLHRAQRKPTVSRAASRGAERATERSSKASLLPNEPPRLTQPLLPQVVLR